MKALISEIKLCTICQPHLAHTVRPVVSAHPNSKIAIIGQAPGSVVHRTGIPWNDKSGERLREWMDITNEEFYNEEVFAIVPMGFCYPGKGKSGDLPPRKECAPQWHQPLFGLMPNIKLYLLIGSYAQQYYLEKSKKRTLTETVKSHQEYLPKYLPLPHPSPRNNIWLKKNQWYEEEVIPTLRERVLSLMSS